MVYLYYISCLRYTILVGNPILYKHEGFQPEWYISTACHCRDIPFWSETLKTQIGDPVVGREDPTPL